MADSPSVRVAVLPDVMFREVGGDAFLLNLKTERYFGLDETGTRMFKLMLETSSVPATLERLADEYEVDAATLHHDLEKLIEQLRDHGLIEVVDEQEAARL